MNLFDSFEYGSTMETALKGYILPDNMDGYKSLGTLIQSLEEECEAEEIDENGLIAEKDLPAFRRMWKESPAEFVEIIAVEWVSAMEEIVKLEAQHE
ncbi:hypothetical protein HMPREF2702_11870 [Lactobacillus sp. HMSC078F07]|jgi:hypothetical protein|uniref:hypothetical protein n=1 Tax=Lacticaseibacillus rhamnosus TaxID=47715 RepID=UPI0006657531|nr:hypothetical protein [Lacticaseibacillus rhamnosus]OFM26599.1 hypothetical protein HMPREF2702_11870 [Lactobacillus sp. HMSC078F07]